MGLRVVTGELVEPASINAAKELDKRIRECLRDYVQLGKLLMEMRDNQAYRLVGPYDTFEDYCKDVEGLAYTTAQLKIKAYLVHSAIEENLGPTLIGPSLECQVKQLYYHDGAIAKFQTETRTVTTRDGQQRTVEVPVAVANPKKVAAQWEATVKAYQKTIERSEQLHQQKVKEAEKEGFPAPVYRRPKLTGTFVVNALPSMYQPVRRPTGDAHPFVKWVGSVMKGVEAIEHMWESDPEKWGRLLEQPHRKKLSKHIVGLLLSDISDAVSVLKKFEKDVRNEFEQ